VKSGANAEFELFKRPAFLILKFAEKRKKDHTSPIKGLIGD